MDALRDLELLVCSRHPIIGVESLDEERVGEAIARIAQRLGVPFFVWTAAKGLRRRDTASPLYDTRDPMKALATVTAIAGEGMYLFKDLHGYLDHAEVVHRIGDFARTSPAARRALVISGPRIVIPPELEPLAAVFRLVLPTNQDLRVLTRTVVAALAQQREIRMELSADEIDSLAESLRGLTLFEAERALRQVVLHDLALTGADIPLLAELKKGLLRKDGALECVPADDRMADVGGLENLKRWLETRRTLVAPAAHRSRTQVSRGVMLVGVEGCGKTMVARAAANEWGCALLRMELTRLQQRSVITAEKSLDRALASVEALAPCVLLIDQIERGFAHLASAHSAGGLSERVLERLLGWLQEHTTPVFVVATSNRVARLPEELGRKGHFDEIFFVDLPDAGERRAIFAAHLAKRQRDPAAFDLEGLAAASDGFNGAEIEQAIVSALYSASTRGAVLDPRLLAAITPLSLSCQEEIEEVRAWARGRTLPAR